MSVKIQLNQTNDNGCTLASSLRRGMIKNFLRRSGLLTHRKSYSSLPIVGSNDEYSDDGKTTYSNDDSILFPFSVDTCKDKDNQRRRIRHEPPKTYTNAPKPKKSALRLRVKNANSTQLAQESYIPKVRFGNVQVHHHGIVLGCNPCVTSGPPIELSWDLLSWIDYDLDDYEKILRHRRRGKWNTFRKLSKVERRKLLHRAGFKRSAIRDAEFSLQEAAWECSHLRSKI